MILLTHVGEFELGLDHTEVIAEDHSAKGFSLNEYFLDEEGVVLEEVVALADGAVGEVGYCGRFAVFLDYLWHDVVQLAFNLLHV
jgi:hypothetical protein